GDHLAANSRDTSHSTGRGLVYEYDPEKKSIRLLADTAEIIKLPKGHYVPGKIHSRVDMGSDGWLYYATHRGSTTVTTDAYRYTVDWSLRTHSESGKSEILVQGFVPKHCLPASVLDPDRLIFYGATAPGSGKENDSIHYSAYDCKN